MKTNIIEEFMKNAKITVDPNMETHEYDPFFLKKAEEERKDFEIFKRTVYYEEWKRRLQESENSKK